MKERFRERFKKLRSCLDRRMQNFQDSLYPDPDQNSKSDSDKKEEIFCPYLEECKLSKLTYEQTMDYCACNFSNCEIFLYKKYNIRF